MHFTPDRVGDYEIDCAELCGSGHYKMRAGVKVVSAEDYAAFMKAPQQWLTDHPWNGPMAHGAMAEMKHDHPVLAENR
jgi:heme/copper-type cytochrome/quinol oxidase subunit 2